MGVSPVAAEPNQAGSDATGRERVHAPFPSWIRPIAALVAVLASVAAIGFLSRYLERFESLRAAPDG